MPRGSGGGPTRGIGGGAGHASGISSVVIRPSALAPELERLAEHVLARLLALAALLGAALHVLVAGELLARLARDKGLADPDTLARELLLLVDGAIVNAAIGRDPRVADYAREAARKLIAR